ncbi:helix-turn-helix domain-containing protein [Rhodococcus sp. BP-349]|uniref:PucR family transcriptional regulator n=1 Tax=unclassified Rhodococcus (in: high G+C Gram-positive bacteria) TaxID=192944 RepID=UPI001C9B174A|nr:MULTISPECIES: helix-turn-helix domain-containing protein [unclassified Rhodococcus (in: high G+C Gram-positive bacteria)]MBY6538840.1 helix-turn-helix domain-containing protein [Rhodococcus sp. BP-363]MBY6543177.1 helix-turn-helix domain-containing protein [Rhodococcus sp. BP-369]MBY6562407.1 helix-turn-helix domain-containing protein [Rhodococcus sp. BP-370]MBY6576699.1 helix-turn-helix domain-containing protein [Rhodococcus sp. BP-364]MBY6586000.1 helix-turn-helix domain-containing protei
MTKNADVVGELTGEASNLIWNTYRGYTSAVFDHAELEHFVRMNVVVVLGCLDRGTNPAPSELVHARELGELRARQGVPLESVIQAFRSTERVVLLHVERSRTAPTGTERIERALSCFDALTNSMIDAYRDASSALDAVRARAEEELTTALTKGLAVDQDDIDRWADVLEFDSTRPCLCAVLELAVSADPLASQRFRRRAVTALTSSMNGSVISRASDGVIVLFLRADEGPSSGSLDMIMGGLIGTKDCRAVYLGSTVPTLRSGYESYRHAVKVRDVALGSGEGPRVWHYREVLLDVLLCADPPARGEFVRSRIGALISRPQLLDTVAALADCNLSQARAASQLFVHVNTVALRAKRISELTGRNPLVFDDLVELYLAARHRHELEHATPFDHAGGDGDPRVTHSAQ